VIGTELVIYLVIIVPSMRVTLPVIDAKAPRVEAEGADRLEECAIRVARVNSQLHNRTRF
jgi:hypothetical protein